MTIKQDGKIGIGNTNPQHKLDITGELRIGDSSAPEQGLHLLTNQGQWEVGTNNVGNNGSNNNQFYIYDNSNQGADYAVTVQRGTGDVGIGTKSPSKKLDVNGDTNINGELLVSDRVNAKNTIKTYTVDFSSVPNNKFAAVKISSGRLDFLEYYHEFFISSGGTVAGGYPNSNFIKVQASGGGYNDTGAHANVEYGLYNQGEWLMLAIYATDNANAQDVIVYLRGGHSSGNAQTGTIHSEAGKYSIHTMSGSVTGYATDSLSYPILNEQFAHNYTNVEDGGEMGDTHYIRKNQRLYNAREYINSAGTGIRPNMQFAVPHDSRPYKSALFDFEGSLRTRIGGILLQNNDGNFNPGHRKAVSSDVITNEIHGVGGGTDSHDVGFLRLSAGGGTGTNNKSYIDLYGYNSNIITLGTAGTERMVIDESGNVGMGTEDPSGLLHMKSTGDVVLRMEADSDDVGESDNPVIHMSQDKNLCHFKIGMNGTNNGSGMTGSKDNYAYLNTQTDTQNYGLHLATENKVAMTIDERQFVGIGTNDPGSILHLRGSNPTLRIQRDTYIGSEESIISFRNSEFDEALIKSSTPNTSTGNVYRGHLSFYTRLHNDTEGPAQVRAMHITDPISASVGGRVGINTNNPVVQLDVKGECRVEQLSSTTSFFEGHESGGGRFGFSFGVVGGHSDKNVHIDMHDNITNTYRSVGFFENSSGSEGGNTQTVINDFTGQHRCISINNISADHYGLIVFSTGNYLNTDNTINPTINDSLPICKLADTNNDQRVLGVISNSKDDNDDRVIGYGLLKTIQQKANKNETRIHINSVGEGGIWVCNKNGNISNGDYITTCSIPGYGAKQSDNILYNYSVAKITCDCDFKINRQTKMRVKVRNVVTTKQVPETTTKEKTTTEFKIEYNEELQKHIRREIVKTVSEEVNVMEEVDLYDEQGNLIYDEEGNTIKHSVQKMKTIEENRTELVYDENGNIQYEKDITEDGEEQFEFEYDTRFLLPDGTLIPNKEEYITRLNNGEEVYIACFVGCSYHCG